MQTFYFYDLETTGVSAKDSRIMQFAGQRTDMDLKPIGEPHNIIVKITEDILPEPDAILVTGITPQKTLAEGVTEAEFLRTFQEDIATPGTIFVGYNTVRFDDEFMRYTLYRNFHDPYEWQWKDDRSRWDLLDMVRMTRALRPEGISWPFDSSGKPTNRLELLTSVNGLDHAQAHDALNDVHASIALARLIKSKQPKLFSFLLDMRHKNNVSELVNGKQPFVYTSGKYDAAREKTTVVCKLADTPDGQGSALVYDLTVDPTPFLKMTDQELMTAWTLPYKAEGLRLPVKTIKYNRCPAVAPLGVLDDASKERLSLDIEAVQKHAALVAKSELAERCVKLAQKIAEKRGKQQGMIQDTQDVDTQLYDGFFEGADKTKMSVVRAANGDELQELSMTFKDQRLQALLPLYKARNYPTTLTGDEREQWEAFRIQKLLGGGEKSRLARFMKRLQELDATISDSEKRYILEELQLYAQSIVPEV